MAKLTVEKLNYPQVSCPHISMFVLRQQAIKITIDDFPSTQGCKNNRTGKPGFSYRGFKKQRHEGEYVIPLEYLKHFSKLISESSPLIWIGMNHIILTPFQCSNVPRKVKGQNRYMPISPLQHLFCEVLDIQVHSHDPVHSCHQSALSCDLMHSYGPSALSRILVHSHYLSAL